MSDTPHSERVSRRRLLTLAGFVVAAPGCLRGMRPPGFAADPFSLGVASGYPRPDGMVLWTRLAPAPLQADGGLPGVQELVVGWEVAADEGFRRLAASGTVRTSADLAHSVHVEPRGLAPGRPYWYRFHCGAAVSAAGRTATAPAAGSRVPRMRIAVGSCQQYEHGYYAAYRQIVADDPDLMIHLGDYIYELSWGSNLVRSHGAPECMTLADYRIRHALYRLDPDLQRAHATCPWLVTWDDHEVDNDYAGLMPERPVDPRAFAARRAAAYRAYYEHLPLPATARPRASGLQLYGSHDFGDLVRINMLDGRQYRSAQACAPPGRSGGTTAWCEALNDPRRSMLGEAQERWLGTQLTGSPGRWNLLAQQTVMARIDEQPGPGEKYWTDSWNGYPAARARLLEQLMAEPTSNPVVLSGDIHAFGAANLRADPATAVVASEFITSSLTSQGVATKLAGQTRTENPDLLFGDASRRGYLRLDLTPDTLIVDMVGLERADRADVPAEVLRRWVVTAGRAGPQPA